MPQVQQHGELPRLSICPGSRDGAVAVQERAKVVAEARSWLRTPYHHEARVKGAGVDCAYLLIEVFANAGLVERFTPEHYPMDWMLHRSDEKYLGWVEKFARRVKEPQPGDVILFKVGRCFSHAGIVVAWPLCIHAQFREQVQLVDYTVSEMYMKRERAFYSLWPGQA